MGDSGALEARERLRRALRDYAGRRRTIPAAGASDDSGNVRDRAGRRRRWRRRQSAGACPGR